ncbi:MAG: phosphatidate cytidylyltransferase [Bacteroidota bacterium]
MNRNLLQRILTALVAVAIIIPLLLWAEIGLWVFCLVVSGLGLWEFYQLTGVSDAKYRIPAVGMAIGFAGLLLTESLTQQAMATSWYLACGLLFFPIMALIALFNSKEGEPVPRLGATVLGIFYCFLPLWLLYRLAFPEVGGAYDNSLALGILVLVWVLDVMAYFAGRFLGKHPLFPRISPKKTWEGAIGGAVCSLGAGWLMEQYLPEGPHHWMVIAAIIVVISQLGDLVESMMKRSLDLKDSGTILPGHGGILDRFDGFYLAMPFIFLYFSFL